jgi:chromosome segregation ATPase
LEKEDFERAISSAERQFTYFRIEQVSLRAALDELKRMRDGQEIDAGLYEELQQKYSQRLTEINEKAEQYRRITQSIRHITRYEKELDVLKQSQQDFVQRLEKTEGKLEEERGKVMEMAERFGIILGAYEPKAAPPTMREPPREVEKPPAPAPSPEEISQAETEIDRLRKEILAELEKVRTQTKK